MQGLTTERCRLHKDKGHSGTWKRYPHGVGATVQCSAAYHLTLCNWVHTSTKWRLLWRQRDREGRVYQWERRRTLLVTCTVLPPHFLLSLWRETDKMTHLCPRSFCLHFLLILYNTMVIGRSGRVCIWCNTPPPPPPSNPTPPLHLPSPPPC